MTDGRDDGVGEPPGSSGRSRHDEDALWREIVENYGDEPKVESLPDLGPSEPFPSLARARETEDAWAEAVSDEPEDQEEGYTPPPPPPVPRHQGMRAVAWAGLLGVPALVLVLLLASVSLPSWAGVLCLAWFVGSFVYLVATMRTGSDGDGWDDGARL